MVRSDHLFASAVICVLRDGSRNLSEKRERTLFQVRLDHVPVRSHSLQFLAIMPAQRLVPEPVLVKDGCRRILRVVVTVSF